MGEGLDLAHLTPTASLNRVRFVRPLGGDLPSDLAGQTAYEALRAEALAGLVRERAELRPMGEVSTGGTDAALRWLDRVCIDGPPSVRAAAEAVMRRYGERLGWLLVTLKHGAPAYREARPDWDETYWQHWRRVSAAYLGGGIVSGQIGPYVAEQATRTLVAGGVTTCTVRIAPSPAHLPLIGAARTMPLDGAAAPSAVAVLDFGQSFVKRALARYEDGALAALYLLPRLAARWTDPPTDADVAAAHARRLGAFMATTVAETWKLAQTLDAATSLAIPVSFASYVRDGQPLARQGGPYAALRAPSDDLEVWLGRTAGRAAGRPLAVRLLHDGTAAAGALAGEPDAAVIMLGTALGIGFPPQDGRAVPLAPGFKVVESAPV